jgi:hypothetical protein
MVKQTAGVNVSVKKKKSPRWPFDVSYPFYQLFQIISPF